MKAYIAIDNFLADPMKERERALAARYQEVSHNGVRYRGIARTEDLEVQARLDEIIAGPGARASESTCFWRRYLAGEASETFIHSDVQIGHFTAILYLSLPEHCKGGLAFWRHRTYGWHAHPDPKSLAVQGLRDNEALWKSVHEDGFDEFKWELWEYAPIYFNRLVIFSSPSFHSRYPRQAFGTELGNSRLIKTWFLKYDKAKP